MLVNLQTNTLDIHRIHDSASCALQRVGQLSLPFPPTNIPSPPASFRLAQAYRPSYSSSPRCLPFYPSPDACLVGLTAIVAAPDGTMTFYWLAIRADYLRAIAETKRNSDQPTSWETWSPHAACCIEIEHPLAAPTPAGPRWLVHSQPLAVREFGLSKSRTTQADQRTHGDQGVGNVVLREALQDASRLQYCDITVGMEERKYQSIIADYEWVVGINDEVGPASLHILSTILRTYTMQGEGFSRTIHHIDVHHVV